MNSPERPKTQNQSLFKLDEIRNLIDKGDDKAVSVLEEAFRSGQITAKDFSVFSLELLNQGGQIEEGILKSEKGLANQVEMLEKDRVTGLLRHESLEQKFNSLQEELNFIPEPNRTHEKSRKKRLHALIVIAIDLDDLKIWNSYGHSIGDGALKSITTSVQKAIREGDYAFRRGDQSDEIVVIVRVEKDLGESDLEEIFKNIYKNINNGFLEVEGKEIPVTAAAGYVVVKQGDTRNLKEILEASNQNQIAQKDLKVKLIRRARAEAGLEIRK